MTADSFLSNSLRALTLVKSFQALDSAKWSATFFKVDLRAEQVKGAENLSIRRLLPLLKARAMGRRGRQILGT